MPVTRTYPGVYIEEKPSGIQTIVGVATSITAFLGRAIKGPVNQATIINSYGDFERLFGGLWLNSTAGFAVRDYFQNGGSQAVMVRLYRPFFATRTDREFVDQTAATLIANIQAIPGTTMDLVTAVNNIITPIQASLAGKNQAVVDAITAMFAPIRAEAARTTTPTPTVTSIANEAIRVRDLFAPTTRTLIKVKNKLPAGTAAPDFLLEAKCEGAYTANMRFKVVAIDVDVQASIVARYGLTKDDFWNVSILDGNTVVEQFNNVTLKESERRLDRVLENESELFRVVGTFPLGNSLDPSTSPYAAYKVGSDGFDVTATEIKGSQDSKTGLFALENADLFNLLCIPPATAGTPLDTSVIDAGISYCKSRRAMMIIDPPWPSVANALLGTTGTPLGIGTPSANAAVFFPMLRQPNPLRGNLTQDFVPCGAVAGVIARTDATRGVWKAPAGLDATLVGVPELSVPISDQEAGQLNPLGINALRTMPAAGRVVFGARTRVGIDRLTSEWKYLPVRRLALFIEESIFRGTQWVVFEPNDEPLWSQIRLNVGAFMQGLFRKGAFQGQTPKEAYFVKCDKETTTQSDINAGIVNVTVGFAPLRPAEFVVIRFQQMAGQTAT